MVVNAIVAIPLALLFLQGLVQAWNIVEQQAESASTGSSIAALLSGTFRELLWPVGPLTLV